MRVISGIYKRRRFDVPRTFKARPTTDFAKENLFNVLNNYIDFEEGVTFEGFLFIITRNMIFNYSRKKLNYSFLKVTVLQAMEQEYEEENKLELSDLKKYLSVLISQLPPRQQEIFRMSREQNLTYKQIAEQLSISEKTVEYHMGLALKYLRKNLYLLSLFLSV